MNFIFIGLQNRKNERQREGTEGGGQREGIQGRAAEDYHNKGAMSSGNGPHTTLQQGRTPPRPVVAAAALHLSTETFVVKKKDMWQQRGTKRKKRKTEGKRGRGRGRGDSKGRNGSRWRREGL